MEYIPCIAGSLTYVLQLLFPELELLTITSSHREHTALTQAVQRQASQRSPQRRQREKYPLAPHGAARSLHLARPALTKQLFYQGGGRKGGRKSSFWPALKRGEEKSLPLFPGGEEASKQAAATTSAPPPPNTCMRSQAISMVQRKGSSSK